MRRGTFVTAAALLLAGPTVLAFYSGGYFTQPRLVAAIVAWVLVIVVTVVGPAPLPRSGPGWMALVGLVVLTAWTALSVTWAPVRGPAMENVELLVLYVGALMVAIGVLRSRGAIRAVEPALAAGVTIVICYGLSGRLLPGLVHLAHSSHAGGRLEQPLTYWNAEGALAGFGFVLCARLSGDLSRPRWMRTLAAAAAAPLGAGVYLTYSRGAIAATAVGLLVLLAAAPVRRQLRAIVIVLVAGIGAAACASAFPGVASLGGRLSAQERDGAIMLGILVLFALAAALATARGAAEEKRGERLPGARWLPLVAATAVGLVVAGLIVGGLQEKAGSAELAGANATRLTSVDSNRYSYWRVGFRAFKQHPLDGLGSAGFRVFWLRERPIREGVRNVHSLELEIAAELGLVGLAALAVWLAGVGLAARRALQRHPVEATGLCAAALVWLLHASIDWDWQMPAVTLPAMIVAGGLVALGETPADRLSRGRAARASMDGPARPADSKQIPGKVPAR
jgi:O-Antigen ligase